MPGTLALDVIDALVTQYTSALTNFTVYDGVGASNDPGNFLMVGVPDPDSEQTPTSAEASQEWAGLGARARDEAGSVTCCALAWNGETSGLRDARSVIRGMLNTISALHRDDPTIGIGAVMWTGLGQNIRIDQIQSDAGSMVLVVFDVMFKARV